MRRNSFTVGVIVVIALGMALVYGGWRMLEGDRQQACVACGRPLQSHARVVSLVEGEEQSFCCLACAFMDHRQTGHRAKVVELTDYYSDSGIEPQEAFLVVGSAVNHCLRAAPLLDQRKATSHLEFDRCSPSVLAFSSQAQARDFLAKNGGSLSTLDELAASLP